MSQFEKDLNFAIQQSLEEEEKKKQESSSPSTNQPQPQQNQTPQKATETPVNNEGI